MGKRKERRIAAMAASRRVKLDIFAEPSGVSGGSPAQDEHGGEIDPSHHDGSPNSPSSSENLVFQCRAALILDHSTGLQKLPTCYALFHGIKAVRRFPCGKQLENPLVLLGQYSDDELEEELSPRVDHASPENMAVDDDEQVKRPTTENVDGIDESCIKSDTPNNKEQHDLEEHPRRIDSTEVEPLCKEVVHAEETSVPVAFDIQSTADVNTCWKVVLHEESNQYYYWNTATGETSWVVPDLLASGTELTSEQEAAPNAEEGSCSLAGVEQLNSNLDVELNGSSAQRIGDDLTTSDIIDEEKNEPGSPLEELIVNKDLDDNNQGSDASEANKCSSNHVVYEDNDMENDLCASVLKRGELLLEKLKSMDSTKSHTQRNNWILKNTLEAEIRLSDAKSLLSFGSSLLPFWVHCERKLQELEVAIDTEAPLFFIPDQTHEVEVTHASRDAEELQTETRRKQESMDVPDFENNYISSYVDTSNVVQEDPQTEAAVLSGEHALAVHDSISLSDIGLQGNVGGRETGRVIESTIETVLQDEDDVDMDVDMEVEDTKDHHIVPSSPVQSLYPIPHEDFDVPPPPGDEWVPPPPPPDSEPVPPPPPDDPTEPSYPPAPPGDQPASSYPPSSTYYQTMQPLAYTEQYSFSYPSPNFEYLSQTNTDLTANSMYQQAQVAVPNPSVYYETLPSPYSGAVQVLHNPAESVAYYDFQNSAVPHGPVVSGAESSMVSAHGATGSNSVSSVYSHTEMGHDSLANVEVRVSAANDGTGKEYVGIPSIQAPASTSSVVTSNHVPSAAAVTSSAKSAASIVQSKVPRSKKRTIAAAPTLRSNKKVSSLVDKWKAAKEEMHEDKEDEPETAYEILEKKRQREIEKWRAKQIATGEAKENANFQPLGGDWRERVKRKRAQLDKEDTESLSDANGDGNKKPDLVNLFQGLPSGWQAYWDESSKQVYYGNNITSETTWTRPGK